MEEEIFTITDLKSFKEAMRGLKWEPRIGDFQLTPNSEWARYKGYSYSKDKLNIDREVFKAWGLIPIIEFDDYMIYSTEFSKMRVNTLK